MYDLKLYNLYKVCCKVQEIIQLLKIVSYYFIKLIIVLQFIVLPNIRKLKIGNFYSFFIHVSL